MANQRDPVQRSLAMPCWMSLLNCIEMRASVPSLLRRIVDANQLHHPAPEQKLRE
jgi:hypothetical protein